MHQDFRGTGGALRFASGRIIRIEEWTITIEAASRHWSGVLIVHAFISELPYDSAPATMTLLDDRHGAAILGRAIVPTSRAFVTESSTRCDVQGVSDPEMYA